MRPMQRPSVDAVDRLLSFLLRKVFPLLPWPPPLSPSFRFCHTVVLVLPSLAFQHIFRCGDDVCIRVSIDVGSSLGGVFAKASRKRGEASTADLTQPW